MEQFKICEKDTKTKAYSKEGLARAERGGDNKDSEREDKLEWVNQCLERLAELNENLEGEIEKASSGRGKTKNKDQIEKLENRMQKNRWHINKLEQVISLIEDGDLDPAKLDGIKENVDFYIESAADDDGTLDVDDEFDMYEDLQIDAILSAADGEDDDDDPF
jgi:CCR4-NOT transcription complex subunit 3